jgi:GAF domain-containing protein/FixJ family two-component response regulator
MKKRPLLYVLDDEELMLGSIKAEMEKLAVETLTFANSKVLLDALAEAVELPSAILADYQLDVEDDRIDRVLKKLKSDYPQIPIIICTGLQRYNAGEEYRKGAYAVTMKPLDFGELKGIVGELANRNESFKKIATDILALTKKFGFTTCLVWKLDKETYSYRVENWVGEYNREIQKELVFPHDEVDWIKNRTHSRPYYCSNIQNEKQKSLYRGINHAKTYKWNTLITIPLVRNGRILGWIDCYAQQENALSDSWQKTSLFHTLEHFASQASETLHAEALTRQLRIGQEITQRLTWTYNEEELFQTILNKASEYLGNELACLYTMDYLNQQPVLRAIVHPIVEHNPFFENLLDVELIKEAIRKGQTRVVEDLEANLIKINDKAIKSAVIIPIKRAESQILGGLLLMTERENFFTPDDIQLLQTMAASAAVAIDQMKTTQHLKKIGELAQSNKTGEKDLAQYVVDAAADLTHADVIFWRPSEIENEGSDWMRLFVHSRNFIPHALMELKVPNDPYKSANGKVLTEKKPIIYDNINHKDFNLPFFHAGSKILYNWSSFFGIPLLGKNGEELGVLSLYGHESDYFNIDRNRLIEYFADQTALALQEQKHMTYLQQLNQISQELNAIDKPNIQNLLEQIVNLGLTISKADTTVLYPFSNTKPDSFAIDLVVFAGESRVNREELVDSPKEYGIANTTRKYDIIVVEEIKDQSSLVKSYSDNTGLTTLSEEERIVMHGRFKDSSFLQKENIGSFIAVALRAYESNSYDVQNLDMGVMYFNYRAPRIFDEELIQVIHIFARQTANIIYRNRLNINLQKQKDLLEGVNLASVSILEQKDPQAQLNKIIAQGVKLLKAKGGKIYRTVGMYKDAQLVAGTNLPKQVKVGHIIPNGQGLVGEAIRTKQAKWENNYPFYQNHYGNFKDLFSAVVEVPLLDQDEVIGVLSIFDDNKQREFTEADAQILEKLSAIAVLAIKQADLNSELVNLYSTGLILLSQDKLEHVAQTILDTIESIIPCDRATIQLIPNYTSQRIILAHKGYSKRKRDPYLLRPVEEDELLKSILASKKPYVISDTSQDPLWDGHLTEIASINSWICLPLISKGNVFGIITIDHYTPGFYTEKVVEKLQLFGSQASLALQRAVLTDIIQEQKVSFEGAINELTHGITSSKNTLEFYNSLADSTLKLFNGAHLVEIYILAENKTKLKRQGSAGMKKTKGTDILIQVDVTRGMVGKVLATKETVLVVDAENDDFQSVTPGTHSAILAPILQGDQIIGLLSIEHPEKDGVDEEDQRIAQAICNLAAISKEKGDLLHNLQLLESFLKSIIDVENAKPEEGIDTIFAMLIKAIFDINAHNIEGCYFFLENKKFFSPTNVKSLLNEQGNSRRNIKLIKLNLGIGFISSLYQNGKTQVIKKTDEIELFKTFSNAAEIAVTPFFNNGEKIGLLCIAGKSQGGFNDQELNVLEGLTLLSEGKVHQFDQYRIKQEAFSRRFNPYIVGQVIKDQKMFFGREDISEKIINGIHNNHFFIEGDRRIGKSSLIKHLIHRIGYQEDNEYQFHTAFFDLQGVEQGQFFSTFIKILIQDIGLIRHLSHHALDISIPAENKEYDFLKFHEDLKKIVSFLNPYTTGRHLRIVVFIDEAQKISDINELLPEQLRRVLSDVDELKIVMTGYEFFKLIDTLTSPFNIHEPLELLELEKHEAVKLIIDPVYGRYIFEEDIIERILSTSSMKPRNIQCICFNAVTNMLKRVKKNKDIENSDYQLRILNEDVDYGIARLRIILRKEKDHGRK